jgi:uncharacterized membrane protein
MWSFLRRQALYFLFGFTIAFVVYLMFKLGTNELLIGLLIGAIGGLLSCTVLFWLEHKFPDQLETPEDTPE